jgi:hypothetical protein
MKHSADHWSECNSLLNLPHVTEVDTGAIKWVEIDTDRLDYRSPPDKMVPIKQYTLYRRRRQFLKGYDALGHPEVFTIEGWAETPYPGWENE